MHQAQSRRLHGTAPNARRRRSKATGHLLGWLVSTMWLFIGAVAAVDTYLLIRCQEVIHQTELNPVGVWLLRMDGGSVALFVACKLLGTVAVQSAIPLLYLYHRSLGLTVATALSLAQAMLLWFLMVV